MKHIIMLVLCLSTFSANSETNAEEAVRKSLKAVTVFIDVNKLTRKNFAAKKMTRSHNEFAAVGYELVSVSPYTENGDLEGFFVSYKLQQH